MARDDGRTRTDERVVVRESAGPAHPYGRPVEGPVVVDDATSARATAERPDVGVEGGRGPPGGGGGPAAPSRFGGMDIPATLVGMLAALALLTLLGGIVGAAVGAIGYQTGL